MRQDIIPYRELHRTRGRSVGRISFERPVAVVSVKEHVAEPVDGIEISTFVFEQTPMTRPIESLSPEDKVQVLERALLRARQALKVERRRGLRRRLLS